MGLIDWVKGLRGNVLYYPGCLIKGVLSQEFENYKEIFNRLGIDFILLSDNAPKGVPPAQMASADADKVGKICCGLPILNEGYRKDARKLAKKNLDLFKKHSVTKIVTSCPQCYYAFKEVYPKLMLEFDIEVEHATVTILEALKKKRIRFRGSDEDREVVSYHDPCYLGRYSGIYDEPRKVIELVGGKIIEMKSNKENTFCCSGRINRNFPNVSNKIITERVKSIPLDATTPKGVPPAQMASADADKVGKIISPCGLCYANLKSGTEKSIEFSTFVLGKLKEIRR
ncbi:MAG: (Fe-S)-binding protein [archaeon]